MPEHNNVTPQPAAFEFLELTTYDIVASPHFASWLDEQQISLAFSYTDHLMMVGLKADGRFSVAHAPFPLCAGLAASGADTLYLASEYQIWRLENALPPGQLTETGYDKLYIPQMAYTTGVLGVHDLGIDADGQPVFVNTLCGCLATLDARYNFVPLWLPPFLPGLVAADCCHLNGLALRDGRPAYVTSVSQDTAEGGWRGHKRDGGTLTSVAANQVVLGGLSMPHSPRFYRDRLWLTNGGAGQLGTVDLQRGRFEAASFVPGFLRGLTFWGDYAIVGASKSRASELYAGLPLEDTLKKGGQAPRHGLHIIDLRTGEIAHWFRLDGMVREIHGIAVLPGVRRPMILDPHGEQVMDMVTVGPMGHWSA